MLIKNNKILFVNLAINPGYTGVSNGIAALIPVARKQGFEVVEAIHLIDEITAEDFKKRIVASDAAIIGFSSTSLQLRYLSKYSEAIVDLPNILQLAGGAGPTLEPEIFLEKCAINGVAVGEADYSLAEVLKRLKVGGDIYSVPGFYWNKNGEIIKNQTICATPDVSKIDLPDYSLFDKNDLMRKASIDEQYMSVFIQLSRGCPNNCSYCCNHAFKTLHNNPSDYFRILPPDNSIKLIKNILNKCGNEKFLIGFQDDLLVLNKAWFREFITKLHNELNLPYELNIRTECINKELVELLKATNCISVTMGLESGDEELRRKLLNRHYSDKDFIEKAALIRKAGIYINTYNILGLPNESKEQMLKTIKLNKKIKIDGGTVSFFYPFPKTKIYEYCRQNGLLLDQSITANATNYNSIPAIRLTAATKQECFDMRIKLMKLIINRQRKRNLKIMTSKKYGDGIAYHCRYLEAELLWKLNRAIGLSGLMLKKICPSAYTILRVIKQKMDSFRIF